MLSNMAISSFSVSNPLSAHFVAQNYCACAQNTFQFLRASSASSLFFILFYVPAMRRRGANAARRWKFWGERRPLVSCSTT
jgi:hypothetical protein